MAAVWSDPEHVAGYLSREIPNRDLAEALLLEVIGDRVERFLDLGGGDGRMLALVRSQSPGAHGVGVDLSAPMLQRAESRFAGDPYVALCHHDLDEPLDDIAAVTAAAPFDVVVSALAIHHLRDERKRTLISEVHDLLAPGGVFANLDLVCSASRAQHERFRRAIGTREDDPSDRLAPLCDQLGWMTQAGLTEVDCHFKWLELVLMVGVRAPIA
jgi:SAM-dependent methyltransferase